MFSLRNLLKGAVADLNPFDGGKAQASPQHPQTPAPTVGQTQHPNFTFQGTGQPMNGKGENWQFTQPARPVATPQAQFPQNILPPDLATYWDTKGNSWLEDNNTGQRYPVPPKQPTGVDQPVNPNYFGNLPSGRPTARVILPVQQQNNALRRIVRGYI